MRYEGTVELICDELRHHANVQYGNIVNLITTDYLTYMSENQGKIVNLSSLVEFIATSEAYTNLYNDPLLSSTILSRDGNTLLDDILYESAYRKVKGKDQ